MDTPIPPRKPGEVRTARDDWEVRKGLFRPHQFGDYQQGWQDGFDGQDFAATVAVYVQGYRDGQAERKVREEDVPVLDEPPLFRGKRPLSMEEAAQTDFPYPPEPDDGRLEPGVYHQEKDVSEYPTLPDGKTCPECGSTNVTHVFTFCPPPAADCKDCGHTFEYQSPPPPPPKKRKHRKS